MHLLNEKYIKAGSPHTPLEELVMLAADELFHVRRRISENERTPAEVLSLLAEDSHHEVRMAVGDNALTPREVLERLARDPHVDVRYALAENPHLPMEILELLAEDENPYVMHRAKLTLTRLNPGEVSELKQPGGSSLDSYTMRDIGLS